MQENNGGGAVRDRSRNGIVVAGSILKIPVKALHKVESGESLSVISDEYNVKIKTICQATEISKTAVLKVGMMLIIPNVK